MFQWILQIVESGGYAGIFLLMVLENIFPPIPSEIVIPLAGFAAANGQLNIIGVFIATTLGGLVGSLPWFILGRLYGMERLKLLSKKFGRILTLTNSDIDGAHFWFKKHGHMAVLFGRLMPTIRTLISVPAGMSRMKFTPFLIYTCIGTAMWNSILLFAGFVLESQYSSISTYVDFLSNAIIIAIVSIYIYRVVTYKNDCEKTPGV
jgi:membrane protein DedA with SNARE-associated domain